MESPRSTERDTKEVGFVNIADLTSKLTEGYSREAQQKTGKVVLSFLDHLKKQLGVHAVVFIAYQDEEADTKISE